MEWNPSRIGPSWRKRIASEIFDLIPKLWDAEYDADARRMVADSLSRLCDSMTGFGSCGLVECGRDGLMSLRQINAHLIQQRGDYRYSSERLAVALSRNELVPIICSGPNLRVLDGHHRLRAYALANKPALCLVNEVVTGTGLIRLDVASVSPVSSHK